MGDFKFILNIYIEKIYTRKEIKMVSLEIFEIKIWLKNKLDDIK